MSDSTPPIALSTRLTVDYASHSFAIDYDHNNAPVTTQAGRALLQQCGLVGPPTSNTVTSDVSPGVGPYILDNAGGTAVLTTILKEDPQSLAKDARILVGDISEAMLSLVPEKAKAGNWKGVEWQLMNAMEINLPDESFTHVVTNFCFFAIAKPLQAIKETVRILVPGGITSYSTWHRLAWPDAFMTAVSRIPGCPPILDLQRTQSHAPSGDWTSIEFNTGLLVDLGLQDVKSELCSMLMHVDHVDEYFRTFRHTHVLTREWSQADKDKYTEPLLLEARKIMIEKAGRENDFDIEMMAVLTSGRKPGSRVEV